MLSEAWMTAVPAEPGDDQSAPVVGRVRCHWPVPVLPQPHDHRLHLGSTLPATASSSVRLQPSLITSVTPGRNIPCGELQY
jgi:hypothetical protein